jgi:hypothetical protein
MREADIFGSVLGVPQQLLSQRVLGVEVEVGIKAVGSGLH